MQLSIRIPARAAITCSIISTEAEPRRIVVRRCAGKTISVRAGTAGRSGKSVRTKTTPVPASAGLNRSVTSAPRKKPNPRTSVVLAIVRSGRVALSIPSPFRSPYDMAEHPASETVDHPRGREAVDSHGKTGPLSTIGPPPAPYSAGHGRADRRPLSCRRSEEHWPGIRRKRPHRRRTWPRGPQSACRTG